MSRFRSILPVTMVMIIGILGIANPAFKEPYRVFDNFEGKVVHNYFIFSVYRQSDGYTVSSDGKYRIRKRYVGIAWNFFEINVVREPIDRP